MTKWGPRRAGLAVVATVMTLAAALPAQGAQLSQQEKNRRLVIEMWQAVVVNQDEAAARRYLAVDYKQHNPNVGPGAEGFVAAIRRGKAPGARPHSVKRLIYSFAKDDLVVLVWDRDLPDPANPGKIYTNNAFDMFRVKNGQMVEHWDDNQKTPPP